MPQRVKIGVAKSNRMNRARVRLIGESPGTASGSLILSLWGAWCDGAAGADLPLDPAQGSWYTTPVRNTPLFLLLLCALGIPAGIGGYTFLYAKGLSYLSSDPKACVNCHIMNENYDGWMKSGHRHAATCVTATCPKGWPNGQSRRIEDSNTPLRSHSKTSKSPLKSLLVTERSYRTTVVDAMVN